MDLFNREVLGWSIKPRMTVDIVAAALTMAWCCRKPTPGVVHHSDRGSQAFQQTLAEYGHDLLNEPEGNCWDNAPTESFFNSLKNERVRGTRYATRAEAMVGLFDYIEVFYNSEPSPLHARLQIANPVPAGLGHDAA